MRIARVLGLVLVAAALILTQPGVSPALGAKTLTFAVVPKAINNPFFNFVRDGCQAEAKKLGVACDYTGPTVTEIQPQIAVLEGLIQRHVDGLAISAVDGKAVVPVIKKAMAAGIPVVTFDADAAPGSGRLAFIGTNNYRGGLALGSAFAKALPGGGKYAIITGGLGAENLNDRIRGVHDGLKQAGVASKFQEVSGSPFPCNDDINRAVQLIEQAITAHPDLAGVVAVGGWPLFAPEALKQALKPRMTAMKANKFALVSFDTLRPELELLKAGYVNTLVGQRPYQMGVDSVLALYNYVTKKVKPKDPTDTGLDIVTASNVDTFLK
ncbi:MAG TPA: sugar-binding protein [bacterium]|nr:sugar-binding protein [bacterium]